MAIKGADVLKAANLGPVALMLCFVLVAAAINLVMGSASAKWAIVAPVFIPMFMLLGYSPSSRRWPTAWATASPTSSAR